MLKTIFILIISLLCTHVMASGSNDKSYFEQKNVPIQMQGGFWLSDWIEIDVPANVLSFEILMLSADNTPIQVTDLIDPKGLAWVSSTSNKDHLLNAAYDIPQLNNVTSLNRSESVAPGTGSLIVPNSPRAPQIVAGKWKMRTLSMYEPLYKQVDVHMMARARSTQTRQTLHVPIHVWYDSQSYWGTKKEEFDAVIRESKNIMLQEANIELDFEKIEALNQNLPQLFKLPQDIAALAKAKNEQQKLNVYMLGKMENQYKPVNGLACLGGPIGFENTAHNCFVSLYADAENADVVTTQQKAKIVVHEIGHYLGLFHTMDTGYYKIGTMYDPMSDTPKKVTGSNMMDPGIHNTTPHFSPQQKYILRNNPALN